MGAQMDSHGLPSKRPYRLPEGFPLRFRFNMLCLETLADGTSLLPTGIFALTGCQAPPNRVYELGATLFYSG
jgi:hypothetical protein